MGGREVMSAIITRLVEADARGKESLWYLIDSICRTVGGRYQSAFDQVLLKLVENQMPTPVCCCDLDEGNCVFASKPVHAYLVVCERGADLGPPNFGAERAPGFFFINEKLVCITETTKNASCGTVGRSPLFCRMPATLPSTSPLPGGQAVRAVCQTDRQLGKGVPREGGHGAITAATADA